MPFRLRTLVAAIGFALLVPLAGASQGTRPAPNGGRATPLDVTGAALFWRVVDGVSSGAMRPDSGRALLARHDGYAQIERSGNRLRVIEHCLRGMAPGVRRDTLPVPATRAWLYSYVCDHLDTVRAHRRALEAFTVALSNDPGERARTAAALDSARAYLPAAARTVDAPVIYGMFFEPGGFGGLTIAMDLFRHRQRTDDERVQFLAHELHHALMSRLPPDVPAQGSAAGAAVHWWLGRLQWEGIASLLDKRRYVRVAADGIAPVEGAAGFPLEHATRMATAPAALATVDSTLVVRRRAGAAPDVAADSAVRTVLEAAIPDGGHALGQYMAMAIEQHGGHDAIIRASTSRVTFLRLYQEAAATAGSFARPFSRDAMDYFIRVTGPGR